MIIRDLHSLYSPMRRKVIDFLAYANLHTGETYLVEPFETMRTPDRQQTVVGAGRSKAKTGYHPMGLAVDLWPSLPNGTWPTQKQLDEWEHWFTLGRMGQAFGFTWGGDWDSDGSSENETFLDRVHFQMTFGQPRDALERIYWESGSTAVWKHLDAVLENEKNLKNILEG